MPESIDTMVLFHVLEFAKNPKTVLKEIHRSLVNGGYLIILGFNPHSIWGINKLFKKSDKNIWSGKWLSPGKMYRLLHEAGFDAGDYQTVYFRPPMKKMLFMEGLGQIFWPYCGASYMFVARKTSVALTPIVNLSKQTETIEELPQPTSRTTQ